MHIHIFRENKQQGPYPETEIREMLNSGEITSQTLAWKEGMDDWEPLNTIIACGPPPPPVSTSAVPPVAQPQDSTNPTPASDGPKGVGGWLVFWCITVTIIGPIFILLGTLGTLATTEMEEVFTQFPALKGASWFEAMGVCTIALYGFIVGCKVWAGNPAGRSIARLYLKVRIVGFIAIEIITVLMMGDLPEPMVTGAIEGAAGAVFRELIYFTIWWFYWKKSKRVRNTYGPE